MVIDIGLGVLMDPVRHPATVQVVSVAIGSVIARLEIAGVRKKTEKHRSTITTLDGTIKV